MEEADHYFLKNSYSEQEGVPPDLMDIQTRAAEEGVPYQTLIASVLHKFVTGRFTEKSSRLTMRSSGRTKRRRIRSSSSSDHSRRCGEDRRGGRARIRSYLGRLRTTTRPAWLFRASQHRRQMTRLPFRECPFSIPIICGSQHVAFSALLVCMVLPVQQDFDREHQELILPGLGSSRSVTQTA